MSPGPGRERERERAEEDFQRLRLNSFHMARYPPYLSAQLAASNAAAEAGQITISRDVPPPADGCEWPGSLKAAD